MKNSVTTQKRLKSLQKYAIISSDDLKNTSKHLKKPSYRAIFIKITSKMHYNIDQKSQQNTSKTRINKKKAKTTAKIHYNMER